MALAVLWTGTLEITRASGPAEESAPPRGPDISVTSALMTDSGNYTLAGNIRDDAHLERLSVTLNGGHARSLPISTHFRVPLSLKPGQNEILLEAIDKGGRSARALTVVTLEQAEQSGMLPMSPAGRAALRKLIEKRNAAMRAAFASTPPPAAGQSAAQSLKTLNDKATDLKSTLAALGAATVPGPETEERSMAAAKQKAPPDKRIDNTAPVIEIMSPEAATSTRYVLAGKALDDSGISRFIVSLNKGKPRSVKLDHNRFNVPLSLKSGANVIHVSATDASGYTATSKLRVTAALPSSRQLIDAALSKGKIGKNRALMYKVFAAFGDSRLPARYHGSDPGEADVHILDRVAARFRSLPLSMQKELAPFFLPPYYRGSWLDRRLFPRTGTNRNAGRRQTPATGFHGYKVMSAVLRRRLPPAGGQATAAGASYEVKAAVAGPYPSGGAAVFTVADAADDRNVMPPCEGQDCRKSTHWHFVDGVHVRIWYLPKPFPSDTKKLKHTTDWQSATDIRKAQPVYYGQHGIGVWKAEAMQLRDEYEHKIWPTLTKLMRHKPLSDAHLLPNGGDGRLDIALVPGVIRDTPSFLGLTIGYLDEDTCGPHSVFIVLRRTLPFATLKTDGAHEFMHAIQASFPTQGCWDDYNWLEESTAVWAQDYVYPKYNWEHFLAANFIHRPKLPLDLKDDGTCRPYVHHKFYKLWDRDTCAQHKYWSYLFFFYLRWHFKDPGLIRQTWADAQHENSGVRAAADAVKGKHRKFSDIFPDFTALNLNGGPIDYYHRWDDIGGKGDASKGIDGHANYDVLDAAPSGMGDVAIPFMNPDAPLRHLSARDILVDFSKGKTRSVAVYNGYGYKLSDRERPKSGLVGPIPVDTVPVDVLALDALPKSQARGRSVEAVLQLHGKTQKSARNGKPYARLGPGIMFCRNAADKGDTLILVPSDSRLPGEDDRLGPVGKTPTIWKSNIGCGPWTGTITAEDNGGQDSKGHWKFVTNFTTGKNVQRTSPMFTDAQLEKAEATGTPPPATSFGFVSSDSGKDAKRVGIWPLGSHMLQYFGAVMSFGTGSTTWTVHNAQCGYTGSGSYKVLVVLLTYNFVPRGKMYRHMMLAIAPEAYLLHPLSADKAGLPYMEQEGPHKCHMAQRSDLPIQPLFGEVTADGAHAFGKVSGNQYEGGPGGSEYFDIDLETGSGKK